MYKFTRIYQFLFLILVLLTSCAKKELYRFGSPVGSFDDYRKVKQPELLTAHTTDSAYVMAAAKAQVNERIVYSADLTTNPTRLVAAPNRAYQAELTRSKEPTSARKVTLTPNRSILKKQANLLKKVVDDPSGKKPAHKLARLGFIISLAAVLFNLLGVFSTGLSGVFLLLALLSVIAGIVLSRLGHHRIKENPEKYSGKGLALAGFLIGLFQVLLYVLFLVWALSWAGAFA